MSTVSKRMKSIISVVLSLLFAFSCFAVTAYAEDGIEYLSLNPLVKGERYCIEWEKSDADGKYYFYLPAGSDLSSVETRFLASSAVYVGEKKLGYGKNTDAFAGGGEFTVTCGSSSYQVVVLKSENIPAMFIETESGSLEAIHADKSHKEKGTIAVFEDGELTVDAKLSSIKGRGNSTWGLPKKPYNIKFEKKTDLFGMGKAKKWSLLASFYDPSFLRNTFIFDLADEIGLFYSSKSKHVDLYINGEYQGNYLVCESIEVGESRVDITDLDGLNEEANKDIDIEKVALAGNRTGSEAGSVKYAEIPNDPADISGGYLLEFDFLDRYAPEVSGFVTKLGQPVVLKSPEYASKAQVEYISSLWQEIEDAIYSENGTNALGKHYTDYIDIDSFAKMYIIEELSMDIDAGISSCYFFKDANSDKLVASPVWDFDLSLGSADFSRNGVSLLDPTKWFAGILSVPGSSTPTGKAFETVFAKLCKHSDFMETVKKVWKENVLPNLGEQKIASLRSLASSIKASATMDNYLWRRKLDSSYETVSGAFKSQTEGLFKFIEDRTASLSKGFGDDAAMLFYDANGGSGITSNEVIASVGEKIAVKESSFDSPGISYIFNGWNTEKDGSGKAYKAGEEITLEGGCTVLYAQWKKVGFIAGNFYRFIEMVKLIFARFKVLIGGLFVK